MPSKKLRDGPQRSVEVGCVHNRVGDVSKIEFRVLLGNSTKEVRFERVGR